MRRWVIAIATATFVASCAGATGGGDSVQSARQFADLLQAGVSYDYDPFESPKAQRDAADLVVLGTIADAVLGRTLPYGRSGSQTNLLVDVEEVLAGKVDGDVIYVELQVNTEDGVTDVESARPSGRVLLFLDDRTDIRSPEGEAGRPSGAPVYAPFVQGVIIESGDAWISGMVDREDWGQAWLETDSFEDLLAELK